jgi:hypothetical protein
MGSLSGLAQVALNEDKSKAFVAVPSSNATVYCNNTQQMTECDTLETTANPIGLDVGLGQVWLGDASGVTRCPVTAEGFDNSTCVSTPMGGQVNGVWLDSGARKLYLAQTALGRVLLCDVNVTLGVSGCVATPIPKGPGSIGLDTFGGRLYVPLSTAGGPQLTVCTDAAQSCATVVYTLNPTRTTTGNQNIAHAPAPIIPGRVGMEAAEQ